MAKGREDALNQMAKYPKTVFPNIDDPDRHQSSETTTPSPTLYSGKFRRLARKPDSPVMDEHGSF
jgi:hypothetical protein